MIITTLKASFRDIGIGVDGLPCQHLYSRGCKRHHIEPSEYTASEYTKGFNQDTRMLIKCTVKSK